MKTKSLVTAVTFLTLTTLSTTLAAKLVWDSLVGVTDAKILQLISDGAGGCGYVALLGGTLYQVTHFNGKGVSVFSTMWSTTDCIDTPQLIGCSKKGMSFELHRTNGVFLFTIDAKGNATTQQTAYSVLDTPCSNQFQQCYYDAKGFFVERVSLTSGDKFLQRYSY